MKQFIIIASAMLVLAGCEVQTPAKPIQAASRQAAVTGTTQQSGTAAAATAAVPAAGSDYQAVCETLNQWGKSPEVFRMGEIMTLLGNLRSNNARWTAFKTDALANAQQRPELALLVKAADQAKEPQARVETLVALRDTITAQTWPVYVYALNSVAPSNSYSQLVIPPERLAGLGFAKPEAIDISSAVWFGGYYRTYAGYQQQRDYWEYIRRNSPNMAWSAAMAVVRIEVEDLKITSNAAPMIRQYFDTITNYPQQAAQCYTMLSGIQTPEAQELSKQLQPFAGK